MKKYFVFGAMFLILGCRQRIVDAELPNVLENTGFRMKTYKLTNHISVDLDANSRCTYSVGLNDVLYMDKGQFYFSVGNLNGDSLKLHRSGFDLCVFDSSEFNLQIDDVNNQAKLTLYKGIVNIRLKDFDHNAKAGETVFIDVLSLGRVKNAQLKDSSWRYSDKPRSFPYDM